MSKRIFKGIWFVPGFFSLAAFSEPALHTSFTAQEKNEITTTLKGIKNLKIKKSEHGDISWEEFLTQRVHGYIPASINPLKKLKDSYGKISVDEAEYEAGSKANSKTWAENLSYLWFLRRLNFSNISQMFLDLTPGMKKISLDEPQIGVIRLFNPFFNAKYDIQKMGVLIHEARHSDCRDGLEDSILESLQTASNQGEVLEILSQSSCTFPHAVCPAGHDYEGHRVCDAQVWGASAIEMVFYKEVSQSCENCSDLQRMVSKNLAFESATRILDIEAMYEREGAWKELDLRSR